MTIASKGAFNPEWIENLPIRRRLWYYKELADHIKKVNDDRKKAAAAKGSNKPSPKRASGRKRH